LDCSFDGINVGVRSVWGKCGKAQEMEILYV
jgi:hypothetical protein